jgi:short-subunit dehydrogenase
MANGVAVVTGASSGIGAELARQLCARGQRVLAVARRRDRLDGLAEAARVAGRGEIVPLALDVTANGAADELRRRARELGELEWIVNNAGVDRMGPVVARNVAELTAIVRLNCESLVAITTTLLPELMAQRRGHILNVASLAGFQAMPNDATYAASKAFVISFSEALSEELRGSGIGVTALCPGPVSTEIFEHMAPGVARASRSYEISAEECARFALKAADDGRVIAIPGTRNRLMAASTHLFPRSWVRRLAARVGIKYVGYDPAAISGHA